MAHQSTSTMTKEEKIKVFDSGGVGQYNAGMYGLPFTQAECNTIIIPVPWEVTVSYGGGTAKGPDAVLKASYQVDLYDPFVKDAWKNGIALDEISDDIKNKSNQLRELSEEYIEALANGADEHNSELTKISGQIRKECLWLNETVKQRCLHFLNQNKTVGLLGGDHSTPLGMVQALSEKYESFGMPT